MLLLLVVVDHIIYVFFKYFCIFLILLSFCHYYSWLYYVLCKK